MKLKNIMKEFNPGMMGAIAGATKAARDRRKQYGNVKPDSNIDVKWKDEEDIEKDLKAFITSKPEKADDLWSVFKNIMRKGQDWLTEPAPEQGKKVDLAKKGAADLKAAFAKMDESINEWNDKSFKSLSNRWSKPYNQKGTDFENNTGGNKTLSEGPMNDPALKALRLKSKGELMPNISQWWEYEPEDVMRFIYWGKGQMAPTDRAVLEKEWENIVKQLHVKYPIPADAEGMVDPPEGFIGESKTTKLKDLLENQLNEAPDIMDLSAKDLLSARFGYKHGLDYGDLNDLKKIINKFVTQANRLRRPKLTPDELIEIFGKLISNYIK